MHSSSSLMKKAASSSTRRDLFDCGGMILLPLAGGFPVHQRYWQLLPVSGPLDGDVTHAAAGNLVLADDLIGAVLENEAMIGSHDGLTWLDGQRCLSIGGTRKCHGQQEPR